MTTLSLVSGSCGRGKGGEDLGPQIGPWLHSGNELLRRDSASLFRNLNGIWWRHLGGSKFRRGQKFCIIAKVKKWKKHDYPWPDNVDPNTSNPLAYLSYFKPLTEKPKPVTLEFEKPLVDLEKKIIEVCNMAEETGLDFTYQINALEIKYQQALKDLYTHLMPIQRLNIARHPNRPTVLDHILNITEKWVELHGDCAGYDDPAIVAGIGSMDHKSYMFIGHQKGRNTKENIAHNFAMPTPHGAVEPAAQQATETPHAHAGQHLIPQGIRLSSRLGSGSTTHTYTVCSKEDETRRRYGVGKSGQHIYKLSRHKTGYKRGGGHPPIYTLGMANGTMYYTMETRQWPWAKPWSRSSYYPAVPRREALHHSSQVGEQWSIGHGSRARCVSGRTSGRGAPRPGHTRVEARLGSCPLSIRPALSRCASVSRLRALGLSGSWHAPMARLSKVSPCRLSTSIGEG